MTAASNSGRHDHDEPRPGDVPSPVPDPPPRPDPDSYSAPARPAGGTGSGCLALACAHQHKTACFVAIDISPEALAVAETNARTHGLSDRVEFRLGDRLAPVAGEGPFDVILANPPYIPTDVIPTLE